jgi:hypothetical protein
MGWVKVVAGDVMMQSLQLDFVRCQQASSGRRLSFRVSWIETSSFLQALDYQQQRLYEP